MFCATCVEKPGHQNFMVEVLADNSGQWCGNGLRFATMEKAKTYGNDLFSRWMAVKEFRVVPSTDAVNQ